MAYDTEKKLEDLILRAIRQVLAEQLPAKRRLYVVFADAFDCRCVNFLRSLSPADDVTVLVDEIQAEQVRCDIEQACPFASVVLTSQARSLPLTDSLTVYPVASRDFVVKAALGLADTFAARWLARCFAAGSAVHLQLSGLARFTGREPAAYVQQILGYYRKLLEYGITIGHHLPQEKAGNPVPAAVTEKKAPPVVTCQDKVLTAADLYPYDKGTILLVGAHTVVTSFAREAALSRGIEIRRT
ncbi:hypothetical protein [Megasphaera sp.]|uniref:hypothetical protein n=1 Tax=Megasphaera sp. TaxID=2023260 RepID=UPI002619D1E9|nr:hypothetical protein [uncultured Megasphaera sp.]